MKGIIKKIINTKQFNIIIICVIIFLICFICGIMALRYNVEGEGNLPFEITGISVIETVEGTDLIESSHKWHLDVNQNNDIYLYIDKNDEYKKTEIIDSIKVENFTIHKDSEAGEVKLYKPDSAMDSKIFKNTSENETNTIQYLGDLESSIKDLKISNQGGLVTFRCAITNLGEFISDDAEEIQHNQLLKELNIKNEDLEFSISFDIVMELESKKTYRANVTLNLPTGDIVEEGILTYEDKELQDIIFKRN